MGGYLRRWGLSFQRPDERAVEPDAEAVRVRREETWPAILAQAKTEEDEVFFADQVGIRSDQATGRTWGTKGCTPIVRRSGNRFSVNAMSAISPKGHMHFMAFAETFDADLRRSLPHHSQPGVRPGPTRRRRTQVLLPPPTPATRRQRLLRRPTRPLAGAGRVCPAPVVPPEAVGSAEW